MPINMNKDLASGIAGSLFHLVSIAEFSPEGVAALIEKLDNYSYDNVEDKDVSNVLEGIANNLRQFLKSQPDQVTSI